MIGDSAKASVITLYAQGSSYDIPSDLIGDDLSAASGELLYFVPPYRSKAGYKAGEGPCTPFDAGGSWTGVVRGWGFCGGGGSCLGASLGWGELGACK
jgi:hypothetical protein